MPEYSFDSRLVIVLTIPSSGKLKDAESYYVKVNAMIISPEIFAYDVWRLQDQKVNGLEIEIPKAVPMRKSWRVCHIAGRGFFGRLFFKQDAFLIGKQLARVPFPSCETNPVEEGKQVPDVVADQTAYSGCPNYDQARKYSNNAWKWMEDHNGQVPTLEDLDIVKKAGFLEALILARKRAERVGVL